VLYALLATPIYKTETIFLPPSDNDIQVLKVKDVMAINPQAVMVIKCEIHQN